MALKQLEVRNRPNGLIWQIYHIDTDKPHEQELLTKAALSNGFTSVEINDELSHDEDCPNWRNSPEWIEYCKKEGKPVPQTGQPAN